MNIEVNLDNLTKEEQEQFNALVKKANKPKSKVWKPEVGQTYYNFAATNLIWRDTDIDMFNYAIGNCFKTRKEAEFALERLKVIAEMKRYIAEHDDMKLDWSNPEQEKWYLRYWHYDNSIFIDHNNLGAQSVDSSFHTSNEKILEDMIKEIGEDRIKKYYFGVK